MSDLEQYAKEHQVPIMMDDGLPFYLEKLQRKSMSIIFRVRTANCSYID